MLRLLVQLFSLLEQIGQLLFPGSSNFGVLRYPNYPILWQLRFPIHLLPTAAVMSHTLVDVSDRDQRQDGQYMGACAHRLSVNMVVFESRESKRCEGHLVEYKTVHIRKGLVCKGTETYYNKKAVIAFHSNNRTFYGKFFASLP